MVPLDRDAENFQFEEALRQSIEEEENKQKKMRMEDLELEEALRISKVEFEQSQRQSKADNVGESDFNEIKNFGPKKGHNKMKKPNKNTGSVPITNYPEMVLLKRQLLQVPIF